MEGTSRCTCKLRAFSFVVWLVLLAGDTYHWSDRVKLNVGSTGPCQFQDIHCTIEWRSLPSSASKNIKATKRILQWVQWTWHEVDTWQNWSCCSVVWALVTGSLAHCLAHVVSSICCCTVLCWGLTSCSVWFHYATGRGQSGQKYLLLLIHLHPPITQQEALWQRNNVVLGGWNWVFYVC